MTTENGLARSGNIGLAQFEPRDFTELERLAERSVRSKLFGVVSIDAAVVMMLTAASLGLPPVTGLRGIHVVNGKPVLSSDLLVAVVLRSGLCRFWRPIEITAERVTLETMRVGHAKAVEHTWTIEQARKAGLMSNNTWQKYPSAMLRARCSAELARMMYADVLFGVYVEGELDDDHAEPRREEPLVVHEQTPPVGIAPTDGARPSPVPAAPPALESLAINGDRSKDRPVDDDPEREAIQGESVATIVLTPATFAARVETITLPQEAVSVWMTFRAQLAEWAAPDREMAWRGLCARVEAVGKMTNAKVWLKKAIALADAARVTGSDHGPTDDPPAGGGAPGGAPGNSNASGTSAATSSGAGDRAQLAALPFVVGDDASERAYLATKKHPLALENAVRAHGRHSASFVRLAALRYEAIATADEHGTRPAASQCAKEALAWASEGPKPKVSTSATRRVA